MNSINNKKYLHNDVAALVNWAAVGLLANVGCCDIAASVTKFCKGKFGANKLAASVCALRPGNENCLHW